MDVLNYTSITCLHCNGYHGGCRGASHVTQWRFCSQADHQYKHYTTIINKQSMIFAAGSAGQRQGPHRDNTFPFPSLEFTQLWILH